MPDTATRTDQDRVNDMLATVRDLQLHLAAEQSEHQQTRAKLDRARQTADREWSAQQDEIDHLRAQLDGALALAARWEQTARTRPAWRQRARQLAGNVSTVAAVLVVLALIVNAVTRPAP